MKRNISRYDIFKLDNYLIRFGYLFMIVSILLLIGTNPLKTIKFGESSFHIPVFGFIILGSIIMLYYGYSIRKKENRINSILRNFELAREISVPELMQNSNYTEKILIEAIQVINSRGLGYYVWDRSSNTIADGRLMRQMVYVDNCSSCGRKIGKKFPIVMNKLPECTYCGSPLNMDQWNTLKIKELDKIDNTVLSGAPQNKEKPFSLGLLIFLVIFFWPGAIYYIIKSYRKMNMM